MDSTALTWKPIVRMSAKAAHAATPMKRSFQTDVFIPNEGKGGGLPVVFVSVEFVAMPSELAVALPTRLSSA